MNETSNNTRHVLQHVPQGRGGDDRLESLGRVTAAGEPQVRLLGAQHPNQPSL